MQRGSPSVEFLHAPSLVRGRVAPPPQPPTHHKPRKIRSFLHQSAESAPEEPLLSVGKMSALDKLPKTAHVFYAQSLIRKVGKPTYLQYNLYCYVQRQVI